MIRGFSQSPHCATNWLKLACSMVNVQPHRRLPSVPRGTKGKLNKLCFSFSLAEPLTNEGVGKGGGGGMKLEYPEKTPTSFRKCQTLKPKLASPNRDSNPHSRICRQAIARKADGLTKTVTVGPLLFYSAARETRMATGFSFSSRWHLNARKGPYGLRPVSQQSPQGCHRNSANICLVEHRSFSTLKGGMSAASFLHFSLL